ncbi:hypothetical protein NDU88_003504 [Pleurodeles waltl]|uniref:Uncharacterized protein n=1 Tax=Pleurodeles waltl TaxID=8319 RepID=A0AAV7WT84_PLEWA|nr:hypothetical protein NDU88_003504 [Pleurodeles waltl]
MLLLTPILKITVDNFSLFFENPISAWEWQENHQARTDATDWSKPLLPNHKRRRRHENAGNQRPTKSQAKTEMVEELAMVISVEVLSRSTPSDYDLDLNTESLNGDVAHDGSMVPSHDITDGG